MMTSSARRQSTWLYDIVVFVLMTVILFTHHAVYGFSSASLSSSNQTLQKDHFITAFGSCGTYKDTLVKEELSEVAWLVTEQWVMMCICLRLKRKAVDEAGAISAGSVAAAAEADVDHPAGGGMETCVDMSLIEKKREDLQAKLAAAEERLLAIEGIQQYYKIAMEVVDPQLEKAVSVTAPQRENAAEVVAKYWTKIDDAAMRPAGKKWAEITPIASKVALQAWAKWQAFEVELHRRLINAGLSKDQADKVTKYAYFGMMATVAVILLLYLTKALLPYVVTPLVRTVLCWALLLIYLPIRVLLVWPVMLIVSGKSAGEGTKQPT